MLGRARGPANGCGFHVAVVDAPGHGDRPRTADDERGVDALIEHARRIAVPVEFVLQRGDERIPREGGLARFDAFVSKEKPPRANAGKRFGLPRFEADSAARFLVRQLGRTAVPSA
ncbi:hypothetical protein ACIQHY_21290 [Streptomyces sp. NPDC092359]|uniref:hypothetical protein n=1 Tax=Streptomyces sp. NPDC092359 TaxID=3366014 RepID=UPI00380D9DE1